VKVKNKGESFFNEKLEVELFAGLYKSYITSHSTINSQLSTKISLFSQC